ncbi:trypsin-like peptidase domain-containing protein [Lachnospiraceae bacterium 46-15]
MYDEFDNKDEMNFQGTDSVASEGAGAEPEPAYYGAAEEQENGGAQYFAGAGNDRAQDAFSGVGESDEPQYSAGREESSETQFFTDSEEFRQEPPIFDAEEGVQPEEPEFMHSGVVQHRQEEQSGFYHYSYNREGQSEPGQMPQNQKASSRKPPRGQRPLWKSFAVCTGMAVVFGVVASAAFQATDYVGSRMTRQETEMTVGTADKVAQTEAKGNTKTASGTTVSMNNTTDITQVAKNAMPSIVAITNRGVEEVQGMFFGRTYQQQTESAGSGVIVSQNETELLIATNNHVVEGAQELSVCFTVETEEPEDAVVKAQTKGTDPSHDLAVIAVNLADIPEEVKSQIKVIPQGDSEALEMGQQVVAIGNALGYGQSLTVGYISALNREVTVDEVTNSMIQTDAAINFGNSGGALLNTAGELIGINSVKAAQAGVEGMGYAIPTNTAMPILNELMNRQTRTEVDASKMGYMGVTPRDVSEEAKEVYNMPAGAFVYEVEEGSPAEAAGIKKGDIITKLDGQTISSKDDLFDRMSYYEAGETIDVIVAAAEGGEYVERTVSVTLGERPADASTDTQQSQQQDNRGSIPQEGYGQEDDGYMTNPFEQFFNY